MIADALTLGWLDLFEKKVRALEKEAGSAGKEPGPEEK
jgi:hypothetical protein